MVCKRSACFYPFIRQAPLSLLSSIGGFLSHVGPAPDSPPHEQIFL